MKGLFGILMIVCICLTGSVASAGLLDGLKGKLGAGLGGGQSQGQGNCANGECCEGGDCYERGPSVKINRSLEFQGKSTGTNNQQVQREEPREEESSVNPAVVALSVPLALCLVGGVFAMTYIAARRNQEGG